MAEVGARRARSRPASCAGWRSRSGRASGRSGSRWRCSTPPRRSGRRSARLPVGGGRPADHLRPQAVQRRARLPGAAGPRARRAASRSCASCAATRSRVARTNRSRVSERTRADHRGQRRQPHAGPRRAPAEAANDRAARSLGHPAGADARRARPAAGRPAIWRGSRGSPLASAAAGARRRWHPAGPAVRPAGAPISGAARARRLGQAPRQPHVDLGQDLRRLAALHLDDVVLVLEQRAQRVVDDARATARACRAWSAPGSSPGSRRRPAA